MAQFMEKAKEVFADKIAGVKKPEADLTDLTIKNVNRDTATFHSILEVRNPYSHSIPICEISFTLKSAGRYIYRLCDNFLFCVMMYCCLLT